MGWTEWKAVAGVLSSAGCVGDYVSGINESRDRESTCSTLGSVALEHSECEPLVTQSLGCDHSASLAVAEHLEGAEGVVVVRCWELRWWCVPELDEEASLLVVGVGHPTEMHVAKCTGIDDDKDG